MANSVSGPIFVTADEPLLIFDSVESAIGYLEWQDVEEGIYAGYDQSGRQIEFTTNAAHEVGYRVDDGKPNPTALEVTLRKVLDRWSPHNVAESATLDELEALAIEYFGLTA